MFSDKPNDVPKPKDTPFTDVTNAYGTNTWKPLIESCQRIVARLDATGQLSSSEVSDIVEAPRHVTNAEQFNTFVSLRVGPTVASHSQVAWHSCWRFNPEKALSPDEFQDATATFDIPAVHESHNRVNADNDPRVHYPKVIKGWYDFLRATYADETPRHGVSDLELTNNAAIVLNEEDFAKCAEYLAQLPDINPPTSTGADWEWIESDAEATDTATSEAKA